MKAKNVKSFDSASSSSVCPHHLVFLSQRPKESVIPDECLTCERVLTCMTSGPEDTPANSQAKSEFSALKRTKKMTQELGEKTKMAGPQDDDEPDKSTTRASNCDFIVESPDMLYALYALYAHWASTVLIRKETLRNWGQAKEVDIETGEGKKMRCRVSPIEGLEAGVVQVPDRMQLKLGVKKGCIVKVKPKAGP